MDSGLWDIWKAIRQVEKLETCALKKLMTDNGRPEAGIDASESILMWTGL